MSDEELKEQIISIYSELVLEVTDGTGDYKSFQRSPSSEEAAGRLEDAMLALFTSQLKEAELKGRIKEASHWADFFEDPSMNALTPSERLYKRTNQLQEQKASLKDKE